MIFDLLTPSHSPRVAVQRNAVARPIYVSNSHTIFGWIKPSGLGGNSIMDRRTDRDDNNVSFNFFI